MALLPLVALTTAKDFTDGSLIYNSLSEGLSRRHTIQQIGKKQNRKLNLIQKILFVWP